MGENTLNTEGVLGKSKAFLTTCLRGFCYNTYPILQKTIFRNTFVKNHKSKKLG